MEKLARVQKDLEAVVDATRKAAEEKLGAVQQVRVFTDCSRLLATPPRDDPPVTPDRTPLGEQDLAREVKLRKEAEAVLAETTRVRGGYLGAAASSAPARPLTPVGRTGRHTLHCVSSRSVSWTSRASCRRRCPKCGTS